MALVLDSSVALSWLLPDENNASADALADLLELEPAIVPSIWRLEIGNALLTAKRRGRLAEKDVERLLKALLDLPIEQEPAADDATFIRIMNLAVKLGLTSYDASYLEVAKRRGIALATLDARLREACAAAEVAVLP